MENEKIKIDKDVPFEKKRGNYGKNYPFDDMVVGDSFCVKIKDKSKTVIERSKLHTCGNSYARYHRLEWKFSTKIINDEIRIWRTK